VPGDALDQQASQESSSSAGVYDELESVWQPGKTTTRDDVDDVVDADALVDNEGTTRCTWSGWDDDLDEFEELEAPDLAHHETSVAAGKNCTGKGMRKGKSVGRGHFRAGLGGGDRCCM
jgi:hypothetical protein